MPKFPVWKQIVLGTDQPTDPTAELERHDFRVSFEAKRLLAETEFATTPVTVDLVKITVAELGFPEGATTRAIFDRTTTLGLKCLLIEAGYRLRLAHSEQPTGELVSFGVDRTPDSDGNLNVFELHNKDSRWLYAGYVSPVAKWGPEEVWVFAQD